MKSCKFKKSVWLDASLEVVFDFHQNPRNIPLISPSSLIVESIDAAVVARPGERFSLRLRQFGLPVRWIGEWERVERPHALVDRAIEAPFPEFRHEHLFAAERGGTRMTDRVTYAFPFGWAGWLAALTGGRLALELMFHQRHAATRSHFAALAARR